MKRQYFLVSLSMIFWVFFFIINGINGLRFMLGGSFMLFLLLPLMFIIIIKFRKFSILLWALTIHLISLIIINYLYSYFVFEIGNNNFSPLTATIFIMTPTYCMLPGYIYSVCHFVSVTERERFDRKDDKDNLFDYALFLISAFCFPLMWTIPYFYHRKTSLEILQNGYMVSLGSLIIGVLIFLLESIKIPLNVLSYYGRSLNKFKFDFNKITNILIMSILLLYIGAAFQEFRYRNCWVIWFETYIALSILIFMLYKFGRIIFLPSEVQAPPNYKLPSIRDRLNIVFGLILMFIYFICIIGLL